MKFFKNIAIVFTLLTSSLFANNLKELNTLGSKDAPIVIYNFTSLLCIHCKDFHATVFKQIKANYVDKGLAQYKLVLINNGSVANTAAIAFTYTAKNSEEFFRNADLMLSRQTVWAENKNKVYELAISANVKKSEIDELVNAEEFVEIIVESNNKTRQAQVRGTPTLIITKQGSNIDNQLAKIEGNSGYNKTREIIEKALIDAKK